VPEFEHRLAVIVVNYGSHDLVSRNLASTMDGTDDVLAVIVDNFTSMDEKVSIRSVCAQFDWVLVESDTNRGFGGGVRLGVDRARELGATHLLLLNPDARLTGATVAALFARVIAHPMELLAPLVLRPNGTSFAELQDLYLADGSVRSTRFRPEGMSASDVVQWASGACVALSLQLWDATGGFDDDYFLYWEDVDLSARVWNVGGTVRVDMGLTAIHDEGGTHGFTGVHGKSPIYYYYNIRNRLVFAAKHLDADGRRRWTRSSLRVSYRILLQGRRRQFIHPMRTFVPAWRGLRDGRRFLRLHRGARF
jgi:N-acetylglucosaminyl-diphospho-decaprenol L-rhamnosyltransferase